MDRLMLLAEDALNLRPLVRVADDPELEEGALDLYPDESSAHAASL